MTSSEEKHAPPTVLIVGAGLGGVMLGALLEKANIPYTIFERAPNVKPLGKTFVLLLTYATAQKRNEEVNDNLPHLSIPSSTTNKKKKKIGSALSVGGNLLPAFEQLGVFDEFVAMSKQLSYSHLLKEKKKSFELLSVQDFLRWGGL